MNPVFKKLNFKDQPAVHVLNSPQSFAPALKEMEGFTKIKHKLKTGDKITFLLVFCTKQPEVDSVSKLAADTLQGDGMLWIAYPKGSSKKYACEFNRDSGWDVAGKLGFEPVRMVAIDEDWSALRFRKIEFIKKMTRSRALTDAGKARIANK